jgi:hypothetical protein
MRGEGLPPAKAPAQLDLATRRRQGIGSQVGIRQWCCFHAKASVSSGAQEMTGPDDFGEQGQNAVVSHALANVP